MKKDILANAVQLADKSKVHPHKVVMGKPTSPFKKPVALVLSERLYIRVTKSEMKRLKSQIEAGNSISALLRTLVLNYLDNHSHEDPRKEK